MLSEDILFLSVTELAKRIQARKLSPVELTESYLDRSRSIGKKLNAYATLTPDLALQQARAAEKEISAGKYRGPLHGIPYAAKDLLAVKGYPTGWGARPYADQRFLRARSHDSRARAKGIRPWRKRHRNQNRPDHALQRSNHCDSHDRQSPCGEAGSQLGHLWFPIRAWFVVCGSKRDRSSSTGD